MEKNLRYLKNGEINKTLWDNCISISSNGLIYAYSFYLDSLCDNWDGLVLDNYEAVMPLPWKKKLGIRYLFVPSFVQQLGVIGDEQKWNYTLAFAIIKKHFLYGDILLNALNVYPPEWPLHQHINFILPLESPYTDISKCFSRDLRKNLKAAEKESFCYVKDFLPEEAIDSFKKEYGSRMKIKASRIYENMLKLSVYLFDKDMSFTRTVQNEKGDVYAIALFLRDKNRIYNILNTTTKDGRNARANHFLLASVIKEFSGTKYIFDFEGSELPGVKAFYENFRPLNQPFYHYHFNNLPFPLRLIKK